MMIHVLMLMMPAAHMLALTVLVLVAHTFTLKARALVLVEMVALMLMLASHVLVSHALVSHALASHALVLMDGTVALTSCMFVPAVHVVALVVHTLALEAPPWA